MKYETQPFSLDTRGSRTTEVLNEELGKPLRTFEARLTASLRKGSTMVFVINVVADTLLTLLATTAHTS